MKRIEVKPGERLSLQKHLHRSEHWVVVSGTATVTVGGKVFLVRPNESTYIPAVKCIVCKRRPSSFSDCGSASGRIHWRRRYLPRRRRLQAFLIFK
jgi:glyoxylate utilization-related uncharacterized protein